MKIRNLQTVFKYVTDMIAAKIFFALVLALIVCILSYWLLRVSFYAEPNELDNISAQKFRKEDDLVQLSLLRNFGKKRGPMAVENFLKKTYPDEPADEHELGHVIGEVAFGEKGVDGFGVCSSFFRFSCYHGVILEAIKQRGYSEALLKSLGDGCRGLDRNKTAITACLHGVGHALMIVNSYDLFRSYQACDSMLKDNQELFFCYDGVSMENVVRRQEQAGVSNFLGSADPLYPCDRVELQYQPACVREHVHYARREFYDKDTARISKEYCLSFADEGSRLECFGGLGSALNQDFSGEPQKVIDECKKAEEYAIHCLITAATQYAYANQSGQAARVCESIEETDGTSVCLGAVKQSEESMF